MSDPIFAQISQLITQKYRASGIAAKTAQQGQQSLEQVYKNSPNTQSLQAPAEILAYLASRMPATYAAVKRCLQEFPANFNPQQVLDLGTGPGSALWACLAHWPALKSALGVDAHPALLDFAISAAQVLTVKAELKFQQQELLNFAAPSAADLVILSYVLNELSLEQALELSIRAWQFSQQYLLLILPGTPRDWQLLMAIRTALLKQGAHILAPCPHHLPCPLASPDWCHFATRLGRSSLHKYLKQGSLGFEDEKFCYLIMAKTPTESASRIIKPPQLSPARNELELCTPCGLIKKNIIKRSDKLNYKSARKKSWGDLWSEET